MLRRTLAAGQTSVGALRNASCLQPSSCAAAGPLPM
jgi:hypothetical protein